MSIKMVLDHLFLVLISTIASIAVGVPLGILAYSKPKLRKIVLTLTEILQTIPALALLGFMMILFGAGMFTVIIGLVLYSLLPIVHNTFLGLDGLDEGIKEAARGMGMGRVDRLLTVELPLAVPMIFTGIRIATVTSVGVAVFATSVGGGGLGTAINQGIRVGDVQLILMGTLTLMIMAIAFDVIMGLIEKKLYQRRA